MSPTRQDGSLDCLPEKRQLQHGRVSSATASVISVSVQQQVGMAVLLEQHVGEGDVLGGQRRAVVEARLGPQHELKLLRSSEIVDAFRPAGRRPRPARRARAPSASRNTVSMRGGASPRGTKLFSVLKVWTFWLKNQLGGEKLKRPPFGASGLT